MQKSFLQNLFFNNVSQGLQFGSRWLFNLALITLLSDADFGVFAYVLAFANILMSVLPFGSPIYLIGFLNKENKAEQLGASLATIALLFAFGLLLYLVLFPFNIEHFGILFLGLLLGLLYAVNTIFYFYFKSLGKFGEEIKGSLVSFVLILLFIGYNKFVHNLANVNQMLLWLIVINGAVTVYLLIFSKYLNIREIAHSFFKSFQNIGSILKERLYYGLQEIMSVSYSQVGAFIMFYFLVEERYSAYRKLFIIIAPIYLLSVTFSQVLLHHLKKQEVNAIIPEFRKYQKLTIYGAVIITVVLYFSKVIILEFLGKMEITNEILMLFTLVIFVSFMRFVFGNYEMLLVRINQQQRRFYIMFAAVVANILSILILVPKYGLMGAVLTDVVANFVVLLGLIIVSERELKKFITKGDS